MNGTPQTSTTAIISLVSGILSWVALPFVAAIVAVITGHMARAEIRRSHGAIGGDGLAITELVLGWLQLILTVAGVLVAVLFFGGLAAFAVLFGG